MAASRQLCGPNQELRKRFVNIAADATEPARAAPCGERADSPCYHGHATVTALMSSRPTIVDVAEAAGVAVGTASNALSGLPTGRKMSIGLRFGHDAAGGLLLQLRPPCGSTKQ
jgi:hypothetical protein